MSKLRKIVARAVVVAFHEDLGVVYAEHSIDFRVGAEMFTWKCGEPFAKEGLRQGVEVDLEAFATPEGRLRRVRVTSPLGRWEGQKRGWVWNEETRALLKAEKEAKDEAVREFWSRVKVEHNR